MWKFLLASSLASLIVLSIGTAFYPDNIAFWLASGAIPYQIIRGVLGLILLEQLFTNPPRQIWLRVLAGAGSVGVICWAIVATYFYQMSIFDTMVFLAAGITVGITALETRKTYEEVFNPGDALSQHETRP